MIRKLTNEPLPGSNTFNSRYLDRMYIVGKLKKDYQLYLLLIVPIMYFIIFKYMPMTGIIIGFRRYIPGGPLYGVQWVGFKYFKMFLNDPIFWRAFINNIIISGLSLFIAFPLPIVFALLLNELRGNRFKKFLQTVSYLPHFISIVVVVGIIKQLLSPSGGLINSLREQFSMKTIFYLGDASCFRTIFIASDIWKQLGWNAILYIAALSGIDMELYEAAKIDGSNRWRQTIHVTIPGILPVIVITLILRIGHLLSVSFHKILLLYSPMTYRTADVISTYVYRIGLEQGQHSFATSVGIFNAVLGLLLLILANSVSRRLTETSLW